ncbi:hypothetical protein BKA65DRAFT_12196 [Rhexocercosporidium sp. MPI-PUGE-AT-0058]|nr:hypothetical protein BKA65DRAFT_12196 [Rhexocercosporidium sp. MPI-PUGE-AT-0058]
MDRQQQFAIYPRQQLNPIDQREPLYPQQPNYGQRQYQYIHSLPPGYTASESSNPVPAQGHAAIAGFDRARTSNTQDLRASMTGNTINHPGYQMAGPQQQAFDPNPDAVQASMSPHHLRNGNVPYDSPQSRALRVGTGASISNSTKVFDQPASLGGQPAEYGEIVPSPRLSPMAEPRNKPGDLGKAQSSQTRPTRDDDADGLPSPLYTTRRWGSRRKRRRPLSMLSFSDDEQPADMSYGELVESIARLGERVAILQLQVETQTKEHDVQKREIETLKNGQEKLHKTINTLRHQAQGTLESADFASEGQRGEAGSQPEHQFILDQALIAAKSISTHVKVLHIPANGTPPKIISLPVTNVQSEEKEDANLGRLPDMRSLWGNEGWFGREVIQTIFGDRDLATQDINAVYYILKTKAENNLLPNQHFEAGVWGDVCIVRQSTQPFDEEGMTRYADISGNVLAMHYWKIMFKDVLKVRKCV